MSSVILATLLLLSTIAGSEFTYTVRSGDSLTGVGAHFGVDARVLAAANGLKATSLLKTGQVLNIDNRHIVPAMGSAPIVVNIPQRMLFYQGPGAPLRAYPVAAGKPDWKTPLGDFSIMTKEANPTWDVPVSIQEEMRREGKPVLTRVLPSPENPLGEYWMGLSLPGIGIHGTNAPASIYSLGTHGCIRLHPDSIRELFPEVALKMSGHIIYEPVLVGRVGDSVFVEVHPDVYRVGADPETTIMKGARTGGFAELLDLNRLREVVRKKEGIARDVTRR